MSLSSVALATAYQPSPHGPNSPASMSDSGLVRQRVCRAIAVGVFSRVTTLVRAQPIGVRSAGCAEDVAYLAQEVTNPPEGVFAIP